MIEENIVYVSNFLCHMTICRESSLEVIILNGEDTLSRSKEIKNNNNKTKTETKVPPLEVGRKYMLLNLLNVLFQGVFYAVRECFWDAMQAKN